MSLESEVQGATNANGSNKDSSGSLGRVLEALVIAAVSAGGGYLWGWYNLRPEINISIVPTHIDPVRIFHIDHEVLHSKLLSAEKIQEDLAKATQAASPDRPSPEDFLYASALTALSAMEPSPLSDAVSVGDIHRFDSSTLQRLEKDGIVHCGPDEWWVNLDAIIKLSTPGDYALHRNCTLTLPKQNIAVPLRVYEATELVSTSRSPSDQTVIVYSSMPVRLVYDGSISAHGKEVQGVVKATLSKKKFKVTVLCDVIEPKSKERFPTIGGDEFTFLGKELLPVN